MWTRFLSAYSTEFSDSSLVALRAYLCAQRSFVQKTLVLKAVTGIYTAMRLPALATLIVAAFLALMGTGSGISGFPASIEAAGNGFAVLAGSSLMGSGMLPAILFGGSFALMLLALIIGGFIGMRRNAPPRPPREKRAAKRARETSETASAEQLQTV